MSEFSIGEKVNARCLNSGVRINKAKLPLFFELDRFIRDIFGYLAPWAVVRRDKKSSLALLALREAAFERGIWAILSFGRYPVCCLIEIFYCLIENRFLQLECGSLALEGVERIAEFPHEYEGTDKDEGA